MYVDQFISEFTNLTDPLLRKHGIDGNARVFCIFAVVAKDPQNEGEIVVPSRAFTIDGGKTPMPQTVIAIHETMAKTVLLNDERMQELKEKVKFLNNPT